MTRDEQANSESPSDLTLRVFKARKARRGMRLSAVDVARLARLFLQPGIDITSIMEDI